MYIKYDWLFSPYRVSKGTPVHGSLTTGNSPSQRRHRMPDRIRALKSSPSGGSTADASSTNSAMVTVHFVTQGKLTMAHAGESFLAVAHRADAVVTYDCCRGSCGACEVCGPGLYCTASEAHHIDDAMF